MTGSVSLVELPVRMFRAAAEQWEGMLREYALRGLGGQPQPYTQDEVAQAGHAVSRVLEAADGAGDVADVTLQLGDGLARDVSLLQGVLDDALHLSATGELLVLPSLPEVVALRNWLCEEVTSQAAGTNPSPWRLVIGEERLALDVPEWDQGLHPPQDTAWLVGDDCNRIIAASPAALALLDWAAADLVGQRLLVVIPHALREAHIAGFTHSVVTGGGELLGQPLALAALRRDGSEIPITLTLTMHPARRGRHVYLARIDRRE